MIQTIPGPATRRRATLRGILERAIREGHANLVSEGKTRQIHYIAVDWKERYNPKEKVRAEFWAELIYRLDYQPRRIGLEIKVPRRTPADRAGIVIYRDDERLDPYAVIECRCGGVSDAESRKRSSRRAATARASARNTRASSPAKHAASSISPKPSPASASTISSLIFRSVMASHPRSFLQRRRRF